MTTFYKVLTILSLLNVFETSEYGKDSNIIHYTSPKHPPTTCHTEYINQDCWQETRRACATVQRPITITSSSELQRTCTNTTQHRCHTVLKEHVRQIAVEECVLQQQRNCSFEIPEAFNCTLVDVIVGSDEQPLEVCNDAVEQKCKTVHLEDCKDVEETDKSCTIEYNHLCSSQIAMQCTEDHNVKCNLNQEFDISAVDEHGRPVCVNNAIFPNTTTVPESCMAIEDDCIDLTVSVCSCVEGPKVCKTVHEDVCSCAEKTICESFQEEKCNVTSSVPVCEEVMQLYCQEVHRKYWCQDVPVQNCRQVDLKNCTQLPTSKCSTHPMQFCKLVKSEQCEAKRSEVCHDVLVKQCSSRLRPIQDKCSTGLQIVDNYLEDSIEVCKEVHVDECKQVPNQICTSPSRQECSISPQKVCFETRVEECQTEYETVPVVEQRQVCEERPPFEVCSETTVPHCSIADKEIITQDPIEECEDVLVETCVHQPKNITEFRDVEECEDVAVERCRKFPQRFCKFTT